MLNQNTNYDVNLPLGPELGGPLFFAHYSFLGLDPRNLTDHFANYWEQNVNHTKINYAYCVDNPKQYQGYGANCWGLTASYSVDFYSAHAPTNDLGIISPTAALSSYPYMPKESMEMLRWMLEEHEEQLWKKYGFIDAFSLEHDWYSDGFLAIDQGPIIIMIENHRTGLLWRHFMSAPEIQKGLKALGIEY